MMFLIQRILLPITVLGLFTIPTHALETDFGAMEPRAAMEALKERCPGCDEVAVPADRALELLKAVEATKTAALQQIGEREARVLQESQQAFDRIRSQQGPCRLDDACLDRLRTELQRIDSEKTENLERLRAVLAEVQRFEQRSVRNLMAAALSHSLLAVAEELRSQNLIEILNVSLLAPGEHPHGFQCSTAATRDGFPQRYQNVVGCQIRLIYMTYIHKSRGLLVDASFVVGSDLSFIEDARYQLGGSFSAIGGFFRSLSGSRFIAGIQDKSYMSLLLNGGPINYRRWIREGESLRGGDSFLNDMERFTYGAGFLIPYRTQVRELKSVSATQGNALPGG